MPSSVPVITTGLERRLELRSAKESDGAGPGIQGADLRVQTVNSWASGRGLGRSYRWGPVALACRSAGGTFRPSPALLPVAAKRSDSTGSTKAARLSAADGLDASQEVKPEQALALVGMGLLQKMAANGELPWVWSEAEDAGSCDVHDLRNRLELTDLALRTGAPLSTAEITYLMGARPGAAVVERGGLRARRVSRNVWKLSQGSGSSEANGFSSFNDGRRRFG
jgi:hypothetical protein